MFNTMIKTRISLLAFIASTVICSPLLADDTEVYVGSVDFTASIQPNILFIIDTSGSMSTQVEVTIAYDAADTYTGSCEADRIYWSSDGTPPSCDTNNWFNASVNRCKDSFTALSTGTGVYVGRLARYTSKKASKIDVWRKIVAKKKDHRIECQADFGLHGDGGSGTYPADEDNGGPWRGDATNAINWNDIGNSYTLYSGNYLNWKYSPNTNTTKERLEIVQEVFSDLVDSISGVNAAVMRFDNKSREANKGGYFVLPMQEVNATTRPAFKAAVNNMTHGGWTPLAETMYEAARYYRGEGVFYGDDTDPGTNHTGVLQSGDNSKYKSPIEYQCQTNSVVMLTDGTPTYDYNADDLIQNLPGLTALAGNCDFDAGNDCLDEMTQYLHEVDQNSKFDDDQTVTSYMIGFQTDQALLSSAASKGGGSYHTADNTSELATAFTQIITDILAVNTTFVAPAVPVNAFNRLTHRNELYFALFRPSKRPQWPGNIKRYQLAGDPPVIADVNGDAAIDGSTGFFKKSATSFWTLAIDAPDGEDVALGGAASKLIVGRKAYTYTGSGSPNNVTLKSATNLLNESNALITKEMLGIVGKSDDYRTELLQWARGIDVEDDDEDGAVDDARRQMGAPLHSNPVVINYGGTDANPDITLFAATNEGYLHAINTRTGAEIFSFMPQDLLPNLDILSLNAETSNHPYGMDGPLTVWANDANSNGVLQTTGGTTEAGEFAYIYAGMRRGGKKYYALDVTNRANPILKWTIDGGVVGGDYEELAQTWSRPQLARIKASGAIKTVMFFGGGYDDNQDSSSAGTDEEGRALFMADAGTGARLWWAGPDSSGANLELLDMEYGIPATVLLADTDADTLTDILFATDVGGQVWRFDFDNSGDDTVISGGAIAKLAGAGTGENRRFYERPDVSLLKRANGDVVYAIGIGSGYRAHPLNTSTQDRYHMLFIDETDTSYTALDEDDLLDVTDSLTPDLSASSGWYINLEVGEKVLARSKTVDGLTLFTTFKPDSGNVTSCSPSQGLGRLYAVSAFDASPLHNLDKVGTLDNLTKTDRSLNLVRGGIQPEPTVIFTSEDDPVLVIGTEKVFDIPLSFPLQRTSWQDQ